MTAAQARREWDAVFGPCTATGDEHFDAAERLGIVVDKMRGCLRELISLGAPGNETYALEEAISLGSRRISDIRHHAYDYHGVQRQAR